MASPESTRTLLRLPPTATLAVVCAGVFLASLDQTSVVTALPAVMVRVAVYEEGISSASFDVFRLFFRSGLALVILAAVPSLWMRGARR